MTDSLDDLAAKLDQFAKDRDWQQFHSPKNLASALVVESAELLEHFQWLTESQSRALASERQDSVASEMADVLLYLVQLATALNVDLLASATEKLRLNGIKYPIEKAKGTSKKYDEL